MRLGVMVGSPVSPVWVRLVTPFTLSTGLGRRCPMAAFEAGDASTLWCLVCVASAGYLWCACWRGCVDSGGLSACLPDDALSRLGDTQGPLLLMLPTDLAAALRQVLNGCERLRVGWEAVADGTLLALLQPGRRKRMPMGYPGAPPHRAPRVHCNHPQGHPRPAWDDLIAAFHDHGILPDDTWREVQRRTLGRDYQRRVRARLLEIRDPL